MPGLPYDNTYQDVLADGPAFRRGAALNPGNRFEDVRLHVLGEELDLRQSERDRSGVRHDATRQVFRDKTKRMINRVSRSADVPFDWTLNPYRGCEIGCAYCFARQYHEYLGFSCGLDFETKLVAKLDAPELLERELANLSWNAEPIVMSASTDVYQHLEHELSITRRCLKVMVTCNQPVSTMTKSALILRDIDLWSRLAHIEAGAVTVTLVTLDSKLAKALEPRASSPQGRLRTIRELADEGIPVSVNIAPVIPGLTDHEIPAIIEAIAGAGATSAMWAPLRLPYQVKAIFNDWLDRNVLSERAHKVRSLLEQSFGGKLYDSRQGRRRGKGHRIRQIGSTFDVFARRYGLDKSPSRLSSRRFVRPEHNGQLGLF